METTIHLETEFLSPERAPESVVIRQKETFAGNHLLKEVLNAMPEGVLILNEQRQIVYANSAFSSVIDDTVSVIGLRPGEALSCAHSHVMPAGCGTSQFCQTCGAAKAIKSALELRKDTQECQIVRNEQVAAGALDLRVVATPFVHEDENFVLFAIDDISHVKRREVLERIFFHDIQNTAGAIVGVTQLLDSLDPSEIDCWQEYSPMLKHASNQLIEEIQEQRQLLAAENGDLHVEIMRFRSTGILSEVKDIYTYHNVAYQKQICIDPQSEEMILWGDPVLTRRILSNMTKNALEASPANETVTLGCKKENDRAYFWVHNSSVIPRAVQLQLFHRSFSTKGYGRGLGTYSMKLLTERYLQGKIGFTSNETEGTTFFAWLPLQLVV